MNDIVMYVLLILSIISIAIAVLSLVLVLDVYRNQKLLIKICKTRPLEEQVSVAQVASKKENEAQASSQKASNCGFIICKKCYAPIPENSVACSVCKMPVGRR